jgi:hypothetical protein
VFPQQDADLNRQTKQDPGRTGGRRPRRAVWFTGLAVLGTSGAIAVTNFGPNPVSSRDTGAAATAPAGAETPLAAAAGGGASPADSGGGVAAAAADAGQHGLGAGAAFTPLDRSLRVPTPKHVRGIYLNAWAAGSTAKRQRLIRLAQQTEINAFVVDVKEVGEISYRSTVPLAVEIGANRAHIPNIRRALDEMREAGVYPIARIVVFRDEVLAKARPDLAIVRQDGSLWVDSHGHGWVDSYNREVWDYNIALAREAIELGFSEIQWDYVRFPDVPQALMRTAVWPAQQGRSKADGIREFLLYAREQLADLGAPITADVFGLTVSVRNDMGIGQQWEKMVDAVDAILPMVYPSHYARGSYGIAEPNANPYQLIKTTLGHAVRRSAQVPNAAVIRPWLQDFTLGAPRYGPAHVRAQIQGVYDAGLHDWILWNPGSNYTEAALANAAGVAPDLPIPDGRTAPAAPAARPDSAAVDTLPGGTRLLGTPVPVGGSGG